MNNSTYQMSLHTNKENVIKYWINTNNHNIVNIRIINDHNMLIFEFFSSDIFFSLILHKCNNCFVQRTNMAPYLTS